jgi:HPt (histidine-containing phosphotransfer) domain-containing protein
MLLRLSRASFWFAAMAAAMALAAPGGRETLLTALAGLASALALLLWRAALRGESRRPGAAPAAPGAATLDAPALSDANALVALAARTAGTFEAALHAVARVLRNELGAREVTVHAVQAVEPAGAWIGDLIDAQPGFRTVSRRVRLEATPLALALRGQGGVAVAPDGLALAVPCRGQAVAAIVLTGLDLPIEPGAATGLLTLARAALVGRAEACAHPLTNPEIEAPPSAVRSVPVAEPARDGMNRPRRRQFGVNPVDLPLWGDDRVEKSSRPSDRPDGWRPSSPVSDVPALVLLPSGPPDDGGGVHEQGPDDDSFATFDGSLMSARLNQARRAPSPADADAPAGGGPHREAPPALDQAALDRLIELDPKGENRLIERVLQAYQTSVARLRPQLDQGRERDDRAAIRLVVHTLKSSSASIGANGLAALCAEIEAVIRLENGADLRALLAALDVALDTTLQSIDRLLEPAP